MSSPNRVKLREVIDACSWHAAILQEDLGEHGDQRYDA